MESIPIRTIDNPDKSCRFSKQFDIRNIQDLLDGVRMVETLHRHDFYYALIIEQGHGSHEIDFTSYSIQPYTIFFLRPGQVHQIELELDCKGYILQFSRDFLISNDEESQKFFRKVSRKNFCQLNQESFKKLNPILSSIVGEYINEEVGYLQMIKSNLNLFFIELMRHCQKIHKVAQNKDVYIIEKLDEFYIQLEKHISTTKQVSQYAELLGLSIYQLNAVTKNTLGKTCSVLINDYIILESKRYLLTTSNQINQIAWHLGYDDVSYFIRFFKKHTNYSPKAYRQHFK